MNIVHITAVGGELMAILNNNTAVAIDMIDGGARIGVTIAACGERWKVIGNNVDENCVGSVCPVK